MSILDKPVLVLNKSWLAINTRPIRRIVAMVGNGRAYIVDTDDYSVYNWQQWAELPLIEGEETLPTVHKEIRIPEVIVLSFYKYLPTYENSKWTKKKVYIRDNYTCQYSGKVLARKDADIDHIIPVARGGKSTWTNTVVCEIGINRRKKDKTPEEAGLKLIREPKKPRATIIMLDPKMHKPESWKKFLPKS